MNKTLIDGTSYDITGGKVLVDNTEYNILKGRTLINGTGYDIKVKEDEPFVPTSITITDLNENTDLTNVYSLFVIGEDTVCGLYSKAPYNVYKIFKRNDDVLEQVDEIEVTDRKLRNNYPLSSNGVDILTLMDYVDGDMIRIKFYTYDTSGLKLITTKFLSNDVWETSSKVLFNATPEYKNNFIVGSSSFYIGSLKDDVVQLSDSTYSMSPFPDYYIGQYLFYPQESAASGKINYQKIENYTVTETGVFFPKSSDSNFYYRGKALFSDSFVLAVRLSNNSYLYRINDDLTTKPYTGYSTTYATSTVGSAYQDDLELITLPSVVYVHQADELLLSANNSSISTTILRISKNIFLNIKSTTKYNFIKLS